jgi:uncharacterized membrane protein (UPF0127 family)
MVLHYKWNLKALILVLLLLTSTVQAAKDLQPHVKFESEEIQIGSKKITVEMAKTPAQHEKGLMYRDALENDKGMLFVFNNDEVLSFWMKNTFIDLSIAYINKKLKIVDIQEMKATTPLETGSPKTYPSKKPAMYALEMSKGWFKKNNIIIGQSLKLPKNSK